MQSILRIAWELGYYERKITIKGIANEVGLDESTVRKHLRRAEKEAIRQHLEIGAPEDLVKKAGSGA